MEVPIDYKPFALTRLPGSDIPFYPEIKSTYVIINEDLKTNIKVRYMFETILRLKGKDGLYRDITCRERWEKDFNYADTGMEPVIQGTITGMTIAASKFGLNRELYICDDHEPSPYQMDEAKRLTYLHRI